MSGKPTNLSLKNALRMSCMAAIGLAVAATCPLKAQAADLVINPFPMQESGQQSEAEPVSSAAAPMPDQEILEPVEAPAVRKRPVFNVGEQDQGKLSPLVASEVKVRTIEPTPPAGFVPVEEVQASDHAEELPSLPEATPEAASQVQPVHETPRALSVVQSEPVMTVREGMLVRNVKTAVPPDDALSELENTDEPDTAVDIRLNLEPEEPPVAPPIAEGAQTVVKVKKVDDIMPPPQEALLSAAPRQTLPAAMFTRDQVDVIVDEAVNRAVDQAVARAVDQAAEKAALHAAELAAEEAAARAVERAAQTAALDAPVYDPPPLDSETSIESGIEPEEGLVVSKSEPVPYSKPAPLPEDETGEIFDIQNVDQAQEARRKAVQGARVAMPQPRSETVFFSEHPNFRTWRALRGASIRNVLNKWSSDVNVSIYWNAPADFVVLENVSYDGPFEEAVAMLLQQYGDSPERPLGKLHIDPDNGMRSLVIESTM